MLPGHHWTQDFIIQSDDIEYLINWLLEKETPLTTRELAAILVEKRLTEETSALKERFRNARLYNPAHSCAVGQQLIFPAFDYATAVVTQVRAGQNQDYGDFSVITVEFDGGQFRRDFAADFRLPHKLSQESNDLNQVIQNLDNLNIDAISKETVARILVPLEEWLQNHPALLCVAGQWFPRELILELNSGHLNLAEAVLDLAGGGPLPPEIVLEQIGGIGDYPLGLQVFSLNYALSQQAGFVEVGPAGEVLWYLRRMTSIEVRETPPLLRYTPIEYDRSLLTPEMLALEAEIGDELSPLPMVEEATEGTVTLIYPHRRSGTLPLSGKIRHVFPSAKTPHIWVTLVDDQDGREYTGWVIPKAGYVYGLKELYAKYRVPIGAHVTVRRGREPDKINIDFNTYKARTEWVRLIEVQGEQLQFEDKQRAIGVDYDDLMILGIDNLETLDQFVGITQGQKKNLAALLRLLLPALGRTTPQGTAHLSTIYSAVNILRRCPPGPIMAILEANPDFENVGGHYWKLRG